MFLLVIHLVLLSTLHLCFDMQKFYWAYAASPVHILYGRRARRLPFLKNRQMYTKTVFYNSPGKYCFFSKNC